MLNDVKKMKNIMHNFDNSDSLCKSKVNIKKNIQNLLINTDIYYKTKMKFNQINLI